MSQIESKTCVFTLYIPPPIHPSTVYINTLVQFRVKKDMRLVQQRGQQTIRAKGSGCNVYTVNKNSLFIISSSALTLFPILEIWKICSNRQHSRRPPIFILKLYMYMFLAFQLCAHSMLYIYFCPYGGML
jgi:hypothetical protein